jgi:hypothetical protein
LFATQKSGVYNIETCADASINTEGDAITKVVGKKSGVGFGKTKLPWASSMLDG